jgi:hypothetical protein
MSSQSCSSELRHVDALSIREASRELKALAGFVGSNSLE